MPDSLDPYRALKRMKSYGDLNDVRPTLQNKPSGLKQDWCRTTSKSSARSSTPSRSSTLSKSSTLSRSSTHLQQVSAVHDQSGSSSMLASPTFSDSPLPEFDHSSSLLSIAPPPVANKLSMPLFCGDLVPLIDEQSAEHVPNVVCMLSLLPCSDNSSLQPFTLPRTYKDNEGQKRQPGLKNLPNWLRETFHDRFICCIIKQVCLSDTPWGSPPLSMLQQELNRAYPTHHIRLHSDDAAVIPVSQSPGEMSKFSQNVQTLQDLGVLRSQIGSEGVTSVIEYLPSQYTK